MSLQAGSMIDRLDVAEDHASFAGHFPKFPVLPGAVLLDEALQAIRCARGIDLSQWQIASVKFLDAVRPGDTLSVEHALSESGAIRFTIRGASRVVASGSLSSAAAPDAGA